MRNKTHSCILALGWIRKQNRVKPTAVSPLFISHRQQMIEKTICLYLKER
jgi:hypothetical protein